jgi:NADPH:quinone reductase-like Zn-dependent oxidoreductase
MWINTPKFNPLLMMNSNKSIFGIHMGRMEDEKLFTSHLATISELINTKEIDPIIDSVWRFDKVSEAQIHMHERKNRGKILLDFSPN